MNLSKKEEFLSSNSSTKPHWLRRIIVKAAALASLIMEPESNYMTDGSSCTRSFSKIYNHAIRFTLYSIIQVDPVSYL